MATTVELERILVRIIGDAQAYYDELKKAMEATQTWGNKVQRTLMNVAQGFKAVAATITVPLSAIGAKSVEEFGQFDQAMKNAVAIMNITGNQEEKLTQLALDLARVGPQAPTDIAKGFYFMASAGMEVESILSGMSQMQKFATAGMFDLETAVTLSSDALYALGMASDNAEQNLKNIIKIQDALSYANIKTNANIHEFSKALTSKAANASALYGQSLETTVAAMMVFAQQGVKASLAGHVWARSIQLLADKATKNAEAFKTMGIKVFESGQMRDMADIVEDMAKAFKGLSPEMRQVAMSALGFEVRIQQAILPLLNAPERLKKFREELKKGVGGSTEKIFEKSMEGFVNQMKVMRNNLVVVAISIGRILAPAIAFAAKIFNFFLSLWEKIPDPVKNFIVITLAVVAVLGVVATAITGLILLFTFLGPEIMAMAGPMIGVFVLIGYAVAGVVTAFGGFQNIINNLKATGQRAWDWLVYAWNWTRTLRLALYSLFTTIARIGYSVWEGLKEAVERAWPGIKRVLLTLFPIVPVLKQIYDWLLAIPWQEVMDAAVKGVLMLEFAILNFERLGQYAFLGVSYLAVRFGNELVYTFESAMTAGKWFFTTLWDVGRTIFDNYMTLFSNFGENISTIFNQLMTLIPANFKRLTAIIRSIFSNIVEAFTTAWHRIPEILKGDTTLAQVLDEMAGTLLIDADATFDKLDTSLLKSMTDGFKAVDIPGLVIPPKKMGELEKRLKEEFDALGGELAQDWQTFYNQKMKEFGFLPPDQQKKVLDEAGKTGGGAGRNFKDGMRQEMKKFDAALFFSAEARARIQDYLEDFGIGQGRGGSKARSKQQKLLDEIKQFDVFAKGGKEPGKEDMSDILKDIREILKKGGGGGIDIDPADFG